VVALSAAHGRAVGVIGAVMPAGEVSAAMKMIGRQLLAPTPLSLFWIRGNEEGRAMTQIYVELWCQFSPTKDGKWSMKARKSRRLLKST